MRTDVRILTATHRDLKTRAAEEKFRADLYYRLGVFTTALPPLRECGDHLAMLVRHCLRCFSRELGRQSSEVESEALERLRAYRWPGNVRELLSVLRQALLQARGTTLLAGFLPPLLEAVPEGGRRRNRHRRPSTSTPSSGGACDRTRRRSTPRPTTRWIACSSLGPRAHPRQPPERGSLARHLAADHARQAARPRPPRRPLGRVRRRHAPRQLSHVTWRSPKPVRRTPLTLS